MADTTNNQHNSSTRSESNRPYQGQGSFSPRTSRPSFNAGGVRQFASRPQRPNNPPQGDSASSPSGATPGRFQPKRSFGGNSRFAGGTGGGNRSFSGGKSTQGGLQRQGGFGANKFQNKRRSSNQNFEEQSNILSKVIEVRRVTRVVKGGKRMRFSALVVVGDQQGQFGVGLKKGSDYSDAVQKATTQAKKKIRKFTLNEHNSIPYSTTVKFKAAQLFLKPAVSGTGLIAGGPIRSILELAGVKNVLSKIIGTNNKITNVLAVHKALSSFGENQPKITVSK